MEVSSIYYDCIHGITDTEDYPCTWARPGSKKFKDLKVGETIYFISAWYVHELTLLEVIKPMYETKGHLYLKYRIKGTKREGYINFGPLREKDVQEAKDNSLVSYTLKKEDGIIGTTLGKTKEKIISLLQDEIENLERKVNDLLDEIHETQLL